MGPEDAIHFPTVAEWRAWLEEHHATAPEVWVLTHKKHTGVPSGAWADAVEEALRCGWIDGLVRRVDEDRFVQRWTPRRPTSRWSQINVATVERLTAEGRMTPAGLETALAAAPEARERWRALTVTWRNRSVEWVGQARSARESARRIAQVVESLRRGARPDLT